VTKLNRLNVDITATTTQFDSAMTRVRNSMATFGRAGSAGVGVARSPGFGSLGGLSGLAGPLIGLGVGIAALSKIISEANRLAEVNNKAAQAADSAGLSDPQAVARGQLGALIGPGGGVESFTRLKDMFDLGGQFMGREGIDASRMSDAEFLRAIVAVSRQSNVMDLVRTGVLPRDILAARDVDTTLLGETLRNADRTLALSRYTESLRQENVAFSGRPDPGFFQAPTNTVLALLEEFFSFFTGRPSQSVTDHLEVISRNTQSQGPGI
jgi:hypothetical protein